MSYLLVVSKSICRGLKIHLSTLQREGFGGVGGGLGVTGVGLWGS